MKINLHICDENFIHFFIKILTFFIKILLLKSSDYDTYFLIF